MRILVAEDHPNLGRSLADGLREEGYAVDLTHDGNEALHLSQVNPYDGILLDVMMPGKDGWSILKALRQRGFAVPILCLTARDGVEDRVKGLDLGADDYLVKPFAWDELVARVRAMIRRGHGQKSSVVSVGDLEIDTARKTARRGAKNIDLSAREFALLEYLVHRKGQVVSRTDIREHVYDFESEAGSNVVDAFIKLLRKKIERPDLPTVIHTHRGHGYRLGDASR